ncbi:adenosylcobinamide-GDP ribazoletransferase [Deferribacter autotrophicus]|uniref:Adenosylcobinamide-GDP ribazoletransferase n=1 Tax=Deferribacter autotrophicus TaxID=500465 RepID=A0A5A8F303_9BACT|nr:adenosylcobinamide-GDP ribazoletransferase [Deferribacter autotrophicus]KAA0257844.1 adenosylcobinamide-GDP ribazoletransferase [Deferribacter autotrophicus]
MLADFKNAISFLTIVRLKSDDFDAKGALRFFPLVGFLIGFLVFLISLFNTPITPILMIIFSVVITGGLHLDGLADTADAYFSGRSKDAMLKIMKDSRIGTMGVLALILILISKLYAFESIKEGMAIILPFAYARAGMLHLIHNLKYLRDDGTGKSFFGRLETKDFNLAYIIYFLSIFGGFGFFIIFNIVYFILLILLKNYHLKKIGGATGDIIGASCEVIETVLLLTGVFIA